MALRCTHHIVTICGKMLLTSDTAWDNRKHLHDMLALLTQLHGSTHAKKPMINHI